MRTGDSARLTAISTTSLVGTRGSCFKFLESSLKAFSHKRGHPKCNGLDISLAHNCFWANHNSICYSRNPPYVVMEPSASCFPVASNSVPNPPENASSEIVIALHVFGVHLYHHSRIAPLRATVTGTHAIDDNLFGNPLRRDDKTTGTHAEGVHATAINHRHEIIFGGRRMVALTVFIMILYLVDQLWRVFQFTPTAYPSAQSHLRNRSDSGTRHVHYAL